MPRTGRRPGESRSRERIVEAARAAFAAGGFDGATVRGIAGEAGVDPALVYHYFGSKEHLFAASLELPFDPSAVIAAIVEGGADRAGRRLAHVVMELWETPATRSVFAGLVRSATSDERAAAALRSLLESILLPALRGLEVGDAGLRGALAWSAIVGVFIGRHLIQIGPLAEAEARDLEELLARVIQAAISAPISPAAKRPGAGSSGSR